LRAEWCHEVYLVKASGEATKGLPRLEITGDVLVLAECDCATRSMLDGVHIIERIHARGGMIKVLDTSHPDLTTPIGRGFIGFLSALAEDERRRIVKRANDGRAAARKGVHMGRKPKLSELQRRAAREPIVKGESAGGSAHTTVARAVA
jgi:DNA invertase Pin-like site-specific DNA recombinase